MKAFPNETDDAMNEIEYAPEPDVALCVNLCETSPVDASSGELENALSTTCLEAGFPHCERLYAGSYFCENYFLALSDSFHDSMRALCALYGLKASLVVPISGQAFIDRVQKRICDLLVRYGDVYDEAIVNDVACFSDMLGILPGIESSPRLGLGRLFSKEQRDARYRELAERTSRPELSEEALACLSMQRAAQGWMRPLVEVDPVSAVVDVSSLVESSAEIAIHLPFCYATTGRNCGPASIGEPDSGKFVLGRGCSNPCLRMKQGCLTEEGVRYVKHGRTYYFENPSCRIAGARSWRIIYAASHETMHP